MAAGPDVKVLTLRGNGSFRPRSSPCFLSAGVTAVAATLWILSTCGLSAESTNNVPAWSLPGMHVFGQRGGLHDVASESERVGPADQPEWTTRRAFAETDIYVIPPGNFEFNQFYAYSHPRHGEDAHLLESEFEFGLPWRTQFDVELNYRVADGDGRYDSTLLELPHALADWGRIPLNPALDAGWRFNDGTDDAYFVRLLLAEEFRKRVHFGSTLSFERQVAGELETSYELGVAANYVVIDRRLAVGAELVAEYETAREFELPGDDDDEGEEPGGDSHATTVLFGPTLLYRPTNNTHIGLMPLFGLTEDSPTIEFTIVLGIDLEPFARRGSNGEREGQQDFGPIRRRR